MLARPVMDMVNKALSIFNPTAKDSILAPACKAVLSSQEAIQATCEDVVGTRLHSVESDKIIGRYSTHLFAQTPPQLD